LADGDHKHCYQRHWKASNNATINIGYTTSSYLKFDQKLAALPLFIIINDLNPTKSYLVTKPELLLDWTY
jgi:hypothetical protein